MQASADSPPVNQSLAVLHEWVGEGPQLVSYLLEDESVRGRISGAGDTGLRQQLALGRHGYDLSSSACRRQHPVISALAVPTPRILAPETDLFERKRTPKSAMQLSTDFVAFLPLQGLHSSCPFAAAVSEDKRDCSEPTCLLFAYARRLTGLFRAQSR